MLFTLIQLYKVKLVFSGSNWPLNKGFHRKLLLEKNKKAFFAIIDHLLYKRALKIPLTLIWEDKHGFNFSWKLHLVISLWDFSLGDSWIQVEDHRKRLLGLSKGCPWPLSRGDHLIQVEVTVIMGKNFGTVKTDRLIQGDHLMRCWLIKVWLHYGWSSGLI